MSFAEINEASEDLGSSMNLVKAKDYLGICLSIIFFPKFITLLTNAAIGVKELDSSFMLSEINIKFTEREGEDYISGYKLVNSNNKLNFFFNTQLLGYHSLPKYNEILTQIIQPITKKIDPSIGDLISEAVFIPTKEDMLFISPLIVSKGPYSLSFVLFKDKKLLSKQSLLMPYFTSAIVPIGGFTKATGSQVDFNSGKFTVHFYIKELNKQFRLLIRLGGKILYSKTLLCYEKDEIPKHIIAKRENEEIIYATEDLLSFEHKGSAYDSFLFSWRTLDPVNDAYYIKERVN